MNVFIKAAALAMAVGAAISAHATALPFWGGSYTGPSATSIDVVAAPFGGTLLESMSSYYQSTSPNVGYWPSIGSGTFRSAVYENVAGTLDFYYQLEKSSSVTGTGFDGWQLDISHFGNFGGSPGHIQGNGTLDGTFQNVGYDGGLPLSIFQTSAAFGIFTSGTVMAGSATRTSGSYFSSGPSDGTDIHISMTQDMSAEPDVATTYTQIIRTDLPKFGFNANSDVVVAAYEPVKDALGIGFPTMRPVGYFGHLNMYSGGDAIVPVSVVPEPESYALMLAGLGLIGAVVRSRKAGREQVLGCSALEGAKA